MGSFYVDGISYQPDSAFRHLNMSKRRGDKPMLLPVNAIRYKLFTSVVRYGSQHAYIDEIWCLDQMIARVSYLGGKSIEFEIFAADGAFCRRKVEAANSALYDVSCVSQSAASTFGSVNTYSRLRRHNGYKYKQDPTHFGTAALEQAYAVYFQSRMMSCFSNLATLRFTMSKKKGPRTELYIRATEATQRASVHTVSMHETSVANYLDDTHSSGKYLKIENNAKLVFPLRPPSNLSSAGWYGHTRAIIDGSEVECHPIKSRSISAASHFAPAVFLIRGEDHSSTLRTVSQHTSFRTLDSPEVALNLPPTKASISVLDRLIQLLSRP